MNLKNMNDNIISRGWKERYAKLPTEIKEKLDNWDFANSQLQVIKRKRIYPQIGDIFQLSPKEGMTFKGVVVNNHIDNINGTDLLLVMIFKAETDIERVVSEGVKKEDLLIPPQIVGKEYWTRGYFFNIDSVPDVTNIKDYGFYSIPWAKFLDEYGNELEKEPTLFGVYGVATIIGVAVKVNQELIVSGVL